MIRRQNEVDESLQTCMKHMLVLCLVRCRLTRSARSRTFAKDYEDAGATGRNGDGQMGEAYVKMSENLCAVFITFFGKSC